MAGRQQADARDESRAHDVLLEQATSRDRVEPCARDTILRRLAGAGEPRDDIRIVRCSA
ncbi:hypothetical protein [Rhodopseudomonas palustris]|uniref:hypothetical protein n=1 Tax=Rhodopseudomonas palustris TaxID=1076 RepID=UPI0012ED80B3|nr:hypothetical protein [Rhodopseudomonas palustris]